jgi:hypothetical protein
MNNDERGVTSVQSSIGIILKNYPEQFLDVFEKLRRATVTYVMSVHLSTGNDVAPAACILMKFDV